MNGNDGHGNHGGAMRASAAWLHLAAAPTFALMALLNGIAGTGQVDMLCPAMHGMASPGGMVTMYLLMAGFHAAPWLELASRLRQSRPRR